MISWPTTAAGGWFALAHEVFEPVAYAFKIKRYKLSEDIEEIRVTCRAYDYYGAVAINPSYGPNEARVMLEGLRDQMVESILMGRVGTPRSTIA